MGTKLMTFVYNVLYQGANTPNSVIWLPEIIKPLMPVSSNDSRSFSLSEDKLDETNSITGILRDIWGYRYEYDWDNIETEYDFDDFVAIVNPADPYPKVTLKNISVNGLQNIKMMSLTNIEDNQGAYRMQFSVEGNAYQNFPVITVTGDFGFQHEIWAADKDNLTRPTSKQLELVHLNWPVHVFEWTGTFEITLPGAVLLDIELLMNISGDNTARALTSTISKCKLRGENGNPLMLLNKSNFTIVTNLTKSEETVLKAATFEAFEQPSTQKAIIDSINDALLDENNRKSLSVKIGEELRKQIDSLFAKVPKGELPFVRDTPPIENFVSQYIYDRTRYAVNNEFSELCLSTIVKTSTSPALEPFKTDKILIDGVFSVGGVNVSDITLYNVTIAGLSNIHIDYDKLMFNNTGFTAKFAVNLTVDADFSLKLNGSGPLKGQASVYIKNGDATAVILPSGDMLNRLCVDISHIKLTPTPNQMSINIKIDSIFKGPINQVFQQDKVKTMILNGLNDEFDRKKKDAGKSAAEILRNKIAERLGVI